MASERVASRGLANTGQPDIFEHPGLRIDFVARQGVELAGHDVGLKFEARNLTGQGYKERQTSNGNQVDVNTYDLGRVFSLSVTVTF